MKTKNIVKKVFAIALALVLVFAMSVPAFAATKGDETNKFTITITPGTYTDTSKSGRYKAYEIFTGKLTTGNNLTKEQEAQLADIKWGDDVNVTNLVSALTADSNPFGNAFEDVKSLSGDIQAAKVAEILSIKGIAASDADATAKAAAEAFTKAFAVAVQQNLKTNATPVTSIYAGGKFTITVKNPGYYLIVDDPDDNPEVKKGDIISEHILEVVRDKDIKVKSDGPSIVKELVGDQIGYAIGELIAFRLTGKFANNFKNYKKYEYKFIDTMSKGLTYAGDSTVTVEVWSTQDGEFKKKESVSLTADKDYTVSSSTAENTKIKTLTVAFSDLTKIAGLEAGDAFVVTYKAYINTDAVVGVAETNSVKIEYSNDPYDDDSTTETPGNKVDVYTFGVDVIKTDSASAAALAGVKFKLYKVEEGTNSPEGDKTFYGVFTANNGTYTLNTTDNWTETKAADGTDLVTVENGVLNIRGLGEGIYYLEEVEALTGYNTLPGPIKIVIKATYYAEGDEEVTESTKNVGDFKGVSATVTINGTASTLAVIGEDRDPAPAFGAIPLDVKNVPASSLPSTGGIGNYVFYIGGALLIIVAIAFLIISKKKTSASEAE